MLIRLEDDRKVQANFEQPHAAPEPGTGDGRWDQNINPKSAKTKAERDQRPVANHPDPDYSLRRIPFAAALMALRKGRCRAHGTTYR